MTPHGHIVTHDWSGAWHQEGAVDRGRRAKIRRRRIPRRVPVAVELECEAGGGISILLNGLRKVVSRKPRISHYTQILWPKGRVVRLDVLPYFRVSTHPRFHLEVVSGFLGYFCGRLNDKFRTVCLDVPGRKWLDQRFRFNWRIVHIPVGLWGRNWGPPPTNHWLLRDPQLG